MTTKSIRFSAALLTGASLLAIEGAQAQDTALAIEEITVTAQRREQSLQDVGIAITAFSGDELLARGIDGVVGLEEFTPNFEVEEQFGNGVPSYRIRGVGFVDFFANNAPTVGIYVDDVAYPMPIMTQGQIFDVSRVEILRGPQGTLYGRNTTGGAVKVISNRPTEELGAGITAEFGRFGLFEAEGHVTGGTERLRARAAAKIAQGGAWQENRETGEELGDQDFLAGRLLVEGDVTEDVMVTLNLHGFEDQGEQLGLQLFNDSAFGGALAHSGRRETSWGASGEFAGLVGIDTDTKPYRDTSGWGASLTLDWDLGFADFTYIGAIEELDREEYNDWDANSLGAAGVFFTTDAEVWSHEARLTGAAERLNWVAGILYSTEELDELYQSDFVASFGPGFAVSTPSEQEVETIGVYAHLDYAVNDRITLVGGLRYEDEERDLIGLGTFATGFGSFNFANGTVDGTLESRDQGFSELTGKLGLEVRPGENTLLYANVSRGIKSGGFTTANTLNPRAVDPFEEEELIAYEAGVKADPIPGVLRTNFAAFFYDYKDQQVQGAIFDETLQTPVGKTVNAPESEIYGFELDVTWQVTDNLQIVNAIGYKDGEYTEFDDVDLAASGAAGMEVTVDRAGQDLGFADLTYNGSVIYSRPVLNDLIFNGQIDVQYRDDITRVFLGPTYSTDSYWVTDAQAGIEAADGSWSATLWGRNIFNADYVETRNFFTPGADVEAPKKPVTYGVRLSYRY